MDICSKSFNIILFLLMFCAFAPLGITGNGRISSYICNSYQYDDPV